jgi:hypothetical protein
MGAVNIAPNSIAIARAQFFCSLVAGFLIALSPLHGVFCIYGNETAKKASLFRTQGVHRARAFGRNRGVAARQNNVRAAETISRGFATHAHKQY